MATAIDSVCAVVSSSSTSCPGVGHGSTLATLLDSSTGVFFFDFSFNFNVGGQA